MAVKKVSMPVTRCTCERCGKVWVARFDRVPLKCIGCQSPYWNKPRTRGLDKKV